jgi:predicted ATPase
VTLFGTGGCGKTRLSVALAELLTREPVGAKTAPSLPAFDRVAFISLVDCVQPIELLTALAGHLNSPPGGDRMAAVLDELAGRTSLLILDNCEQLNDAAARHFEQLLGGLPSLHLLLTSRRRFDLDGELGYALNGLHAPDVTTPINALRQNDAVALFLARAHDVTRLRDFDLADVADLVRHLQGMPLAIELAAGRMRSMTPLELLRRLQERSGSPMLDQLARRAAGDAATDRHASMRQVIASTWSQLDSDQVRLMQALAVLSSPGQLDAVAATAGIDAGLAQDLVEQLRDRNLLQAADVDGRTCFSMLQPLREFAAEQLGAMAGQQLRARLRQWLSGLGSGITTDGMAASGHDAGLIRTAIETASADGADTHGIELALLFRPLWDAEPLPAATLEAIAGMLPKLRNESLLGDAHALLAHGFGVLGVMQRGLDHAKSALALADDEGRRAEARCSMAVLSYFSDGFQAGSDGEVRQAEALARRHSNVRALAGVMRLRAVIATNVHQDFEQAERCLAEAQQLCEQLGSRRLSNGRLLERAVLWWGLGQRERALAMLQACERTSVELKDWSTRMAVHWYRARFFIRQRRWRDALTTNQEGIRIGWEHHSSHHLPMVMLHLPEILVMYGRAEDAARLQGYATHHYQRLRGALNVIEAREVKAGRRMIRLHLGPARAESLRIEGATMTLAKAVSLALAAPGAGSPAEG